MSDTGKCEKCASEILTEAERCPECGYEPGDLGILGGLGVGLLVFINGLLVLLLVLIWLVAFGTDFEFSGAVTLTGFFGVILLITGSLMYNAMQKEMEMPTGETKDMKEEIFNS